VTAAIRARAATTPDELALGDDSGFRTWAQAAADLERAAGAMLAVASDPAHRISVLGDNAIPTLEAHAAGLTVGVGTVATSRQLRANGNCGKFHLGMLVEGQLKVTGGTDDDNRQDDHRSKNGTPDAQFCESLHG